MVKLVSEAAEDERIRSAPPVLRLGLLAALLAWAAFACSAEERKPLVHAAPDRGGSAGSARGGTGGVTGEAGEGPSSGGSSSPTGGTSGTGGNAGFFDPNEIYFTGRIYPRMALTYESAIANLKAPDRYAMGFPSGFTARLLGSTLVYSIFSGSLYRFTIDSVSTAPPENITYPANPTANDRLISTPPCQADPTPELGETTGPTRFVTSPDERLVYYCPGEGWFDDGALVAGDLTDIYAVGHDGLFIDSSASYLARLGPLGETEAISELPFDNVLAARATATGFHLAVGDRLEPELWDVESDGTSRLLGTYPPLSPSASDFIDATLAVDDALYQIYVSSIVRRTIDGDNEVVFPTEPSPNVAPYQSGLLTGP